MNQAVPKPPGSTWTDEQWEAITVTGRDLLVAAAAGSGKTAVLVERIIRRISDEKDPVDVDRLLVATFTKAAAAEMRERIREALEKELLKRPDSDHLRKQLALMNRAQITTLHSFCLEVIRRYYERIGLDPGFRMADETEAQLIRLDVLEELLEEKYARSDEGSAFWRLADAFSGERSDSELYALVLRLYDQSRSHPWPEYWLRNTAEAFREEAAAVREGRGRWLDSLTADVRLELEGLQRLLDEAARIARKPGGPQPYLANLEEDRALVDEMLQAAETGWNEMHVRFRNVRFGRLKACRGDGFDKGLQEQVKELRGEVKDRLTAIGEELFTRTPEEYARELEDLAPLMGELVSLAEEFAERYAEAKSGKGLLDFADLEHYCLRILRDPASTPQRLVPSRPALDYRSQFAEILLDEYQDTNRVQETIVALISRGEPGNRFMVGDVKQSIYRFRLAEPGLFLAKYRAYASASEGRKADPGGAKGRRIDLARNFRSRREVVDGVNFVFRQIMNGKVGEIAYDADAELIRGAEYPEPGCTDDYAVELKLLERQPEAQEESGTDGEPSAFAEEDESARPDGAEAFSPESREARERQELETAQLEARLIALEIRRMTGADGESPPFAVFDKRIPGMRPVEFRDIVILLRATREWAPVLIEELKQAGIPAYAELGTGYFDAVEIETVMALLNLIDNPYQDIPLAAVLRSPLVGLSAEDLAQIRIRGRRMPFFDAVLKCAGMAPSLPKDPECDSPPPEREAHADWQEPDPALRSVLADFLARLETWRREARQGALADLIWKIYTETGYYDFVGGMPGGLQRQANLRALYDRARQYEATSFRGLFRFLRFIERMRDSGGDLGTARALGEQEDVVRIMTIHKSKGLEFPVVFMAGLGKGFNRTDLNGRFLLHRELGFGPKVIDPSLRVSYPSLPALAIRRRMRMELLAEEMRVLYVALTRAREKLVLVGTVHSAAKAAARWDRLGRGPEWPLPDDGLAGASCYLDWLGPAVLRHRSAQPLREAAGLPAEADPCLAAQDPSRWKVELWPGRQFAGQSAPSEARRPPDGDRLEALIRLAPVEAEPSAWAGEIGRVLGWKDPHSRLSVLPAKTTVTEIKRLAEERALIAAEELPPASLWESAGAGAGLREAAAGRASDFPSGPRFGSGEGRQRATAASGPARVPALLKRPRFMEKRALTPAERGVVYHALMQHLPLDRAEMTGEIVRQTALEMRDRELLTDEQVSVIDPGVILSFFSHEAGRRLLRADRVYRELPFSFGLPAAEVYGEEEAGPEGEIVLIQGVIDCLFFEGEQPVLLDYKTDAVYGNRMDDLVRRYRIQMELYARAVEQIWKRPVAGKYLYFFDAGRVVPL